MVGHGRLSVVVSGSPEPEPAESQEQERESSPRIAGASDVAHKIKSSLSAITMNLEFALEQLPPGPELDAVRDALLDCRSAGERLLRGIGELTRAVEADRLR